MPRVAVVSGGTRGIGAAISKALLAAGYKVAANYAGNNNAAAAFNREIRIVVYKWEWPCENGGSSARDDPGAQRLLDSCPDRRDQ